MTMRHEKMTKKPKKSKAITKGEHFEDVAKKLFKVPKTEITEKGTKP